ncbi:TolC family outer membrane protein [Bosea sp. MMO-172]|uniref:TolC family outer membrane protein n=1 Tax=Bosea sp. MMO-172 TaxID=3127885 RepID=UPI0030191AC0
MKQMELTTRDRARLGRSTLVLAFTFAFSGSSSSQTLDAALARAYVSNPILNAERASVRAVDEDVPQAMSGYRPKITASADIGASITGERVPSLAGGPGTRSTDRMAPRGVGLQVDQMLFDGGRTRSAVGAAESQVLGARARLDNTEQNVLLDAVTSYMNVLRDTAILELNRNNVEVLSQQVDQTKSRYSAGEVTRTDIAQSEARKSAASSQEILAEANLKSSVAKYRQNIGAEPSRLAPGRTIENMLPKNLTSAVSAALVQHPAVLAAMHGVDAAELNVKVSQSDLAPSVNIRGIVQNRNDTQYFGDRQLSASLVGSLTIPIYEGGAVYARTRQAKETAGQRRIEVDAQRDTIRAAVISSWGGYEAAKAQIAAAQSQVRAAETALAGVREEAKVGQRTTLDVLNAQQELVIARSSLVTAQRDRVVSSYAVLSSIGKLSAKTLALKAEIYDARKHYQQVRDKPWGLQIPGGQ